MEPIRILILEDNPADVELVQFELQEAGIEFTAKVVMTEKDFIREVLEFSPDLILSDYDLPNTTVHWHLPRQEEDVLIPHSFLSPTL